MNKPKYILFLLHLPPPVHGSSVSGQAIKNSVLINNSFKCKFINLLASRKIRDTGKMSFIKVIRFVGVWFRLLIEISNKRPDVCYLALTAKGSAFFKDVVLIALLKMFRVKRVYHLHNKGVRSHQHKIINRLCYRFVFKDAKVILLSERLYADVQFFVPNSIVHICPNGIPDRGSNHDHITRIRGQDSKKEVQILFLSNLIESKGIFILLQACSIMYEKGVPFKCNVVGGEGDVTKLQFYEHVNKVGLKGQVNYLGEKYEEEKVEIFLRTDIFALPTYNETFGLVNLEAMQYSLPVVSTFEGGIPDIVEDGVTGFLVPQRDAVALAKALEVLIINPELRQQMGRAGRLKYEKEFTLEKFEHRLTNILAQ